MAFFSLNYQLPTMQDQSQIHTIDPIKWENTTITGIKDDSLNIISSSGLSIFQKKRIKAKEKLLRGIITNNTDLVKEAMKTKLIDIEEEISVVTNDLKNPIKTFKITDAGKYSGLGVVNYLTKTYNNITQKESAKNYIHSTEFKTYPKTEYLKTKTFEGEKRFTVPEYAIRYINNKIDYDGTEIIGVMKKVKLDPLKIDDLGLGNELIFQGIMEENLDLIKKAINEYDVNPALNIFLVTKKKQCLRVNLLHEAKMKKNKNITKYLEETIHKKQEETIKKINDLKKKDYINWLNSSSNDYSKCASHIHWQTVNIAGKQLDELILGIRKTNVNAVRANGFNPIDEQIVPKKSEIQILNERKLILGVLYNDQNCVRDALETGTIERELIISVVTYNPMFKKERYFNVLQEATKRGVKEIIHLLSCYKMGIDIFK